MTHERYEAIIALKHCFHALKAHMHVVHHAWRAAVRKGNLDRQLSLIQSTPRHPLLWWGMKPTLSMRSIIVLGHHRNGHGNVECFRMNRAVSHTFVPST